MDAFEKWKPVNGYGGSSLDAIAEQAFRAGMRAAPRRDLPARRKGSTRRSEEAMLTCSCGDYEDFDWWYSDAEPIAPLATKRARKCKSCKERIAVGDDCKPFARWRRPEYDSIEERICGDEVGMATWYLCDRCAGLYESLASLGFCDLLGHDMRELCREYADMQREAGVFRGQMIVRKP